MFLIIHELSINAPKVWRTLGSAQKALAERSRLKYAARWPSRMQFAVGIPPSSHGVADGFAENAIIATKARRRA